MMENQISKRGDTLALAGGLLLAIIIATTYILGITSATQDLDQALNPDQAEVPVPVYDLESAAKLNLKGLSPAR